MNIVGRVGLQQRALVLTGAGFCLLLGIFLALAIRTTDESFKARSEDRLTMVRMLADNLDRRLLATKEEMIELAAIMGQTDRLPQDGDLSSPKSPVDNYRSLTEYHREFPLSLFLASSDGEILWTEAADTMALISKVGPRLAAAPNPGQADIFSISVATGNQDLAIATARLGSGNLILGGVFDPSSPGVSALDVVAEPMRLGRTGSVQIIGELGTVVAQTRPNDPGWVPVQDPDLIHIVGDAKSTIALSFSLKSEGKSQLKREDTLALAPLSNAPWVVVTRKSKEEFTAEVLDTQRLFLIVGGIILFVAVAITGLSARSITRPLVRLTNGAERLATGDLSEPISVSGPAEVGRLVDAFETMRVRLKATLDEVDSWNKTLEERVAQKTAALQDVSERLAAEQQQVQLLLAKQIQSQEEERRRISLDIHDGIVQPLAGTLYRLHSLSDERSDPLLQRETARAVANIVSQTIRDLRRLIYNLRPASLDTAGLVPAIRHNLEEFETAHFVACELRVIGREDQLTPERKVSLFRIFQEAMNNVAKHAQATSVHVYLHFSPGHLRLAIVDDGRGFLVRDPKQDGPVSSQMGVRGMHERAEIIGAQLKVISLPGRGTAVITSLPRRSPIPSEFSTLKVASADREALVLE